MPGSSSFSRAFARTVSLRRARVLASLASLLVMASLAAAVPAVSQADTGYLPETPTLATITGTQSNPAPWNEWQGDSAGSELTSPFTIFETTSGGGTTNTSIASVVDPQQVLPTYEPASGQTAYPNVALDQGATAADSDTTVPYQSGVAGTPGPLAGYCASGDFNAETGLGQSSQPGVSTQPATETLPLGPAYFPHIVLNADGSLTGYFDYRPKDENEAVVAATSTDGGKDWTFDQEALQQNANYCASGDTNDDGQGHPNVLNFGGTTTAGDVTSGGTNDLFTLQRAAGDNAGVGMLVHNLTAAGATASQPLGNLPSSQKSGLDPDAFDEDAAAVTVPTLGSGQTTTLTVSSTGTPGTLYDLVPGGFVDLGASGTPSPSNASAADVIQCTGVTPSSNPADTSLGTPTSPATGTTGQLTGCAVNGPSSLTVNPQDMIAQVLGYVSAQTPTSSNATSGDAQTTATAGSADATFPFTLPTGPGSEAADGGYAQIDVSPNTTDAAVTSANTADLGFTYELTGQQLNVNAPDRYYFDGTTTYCVQSNNNPTSEIENCTVPVGTTAPSLHVGDPILADPIIPAGTQMTTGLIAPDGIVGELHSFPSDGSFSIPANATYVMYDEKELDYYVAGETDKIVPTGETKGYFHSSSASSSQTFSIPFNPWEYLAQDLAANITVTGSAGSQSFTVGNGSNTTVTVLMGDDTTGNVDYVTCQGASTGDGGSATTPDNTGASLVSGSSDFLNDCTFSNPSGGLNYISIKGAPSPTTAPLPKDKLSSNTMLAAPGAAVEQPDQLQQTGEGKAASASNSAKLFSNNEDLSVLRVAWTTDGVNFYSAGLQGAGLISGTDTTSQAATNGPTNACTSDTSYTDLSNPNTLCNPENGSGLVDLNEYAAAGTQLATEQRWPGSGGSIIYNPTTGEDELFLSGAWAGDGDSDAFNDVYYATSTNGLDWTVPQTVVSTDYSFSASEAQDSMLKAGTDTAVGISAYYSGRAYGPAVVPNPDGGGFWMVFAGYNVPKGAGTAGAVLNPAAVSGVTAQYPSPSGQATGAWTVGSGGNGDDPAMYRNILVDDIEVDGAASITFDAPTDSPTYGGSDTLSATSPSDETISYSVDATSGTGVCSVTNGTVSYTGAGTCVIDATQAAGDGYSEAGSAQISYTVAQAPLTITASSGTSVYGAAAPTITAGYSGFVNGDTSSSLTTAPTCSSTSTSSSPVGTSYTTSCSGAVDPNYSFTYVNGTASVTKAPLTITASNGTSVYGAAAPTITAGYSGFVNGDTSSSLTTAPTCSSTSTSSSPVGTSYTTSCSGAVDPNYSFTYDNGTASVTKAPLQITASSGTSVYGAAAPTITAEYSGFVNGDTSSSLTTAPTCSSTSTSSSEVGNDYVTSCSGAVDPNYSFTYVNGTAAVTQATLTITASNATSVYGGTAPTITPNYSGFVNGDTSAALETAPSCVSNTTASSPVGDAYHSSCSGAADPNYSIVYDTGTVTITKAPLTVTASGGVVSYGDNPPAITPSYSGFVNGDTVSSLTTAPTCSTGASNTSDVGVYSTSCSGGVASNYAFFYVPNDIIVDADSTTTSLSAASSAIKTTASDKLTVKVDTSSHVTATGPVQFYDNGKLVKTISLGGGKATYTLSGLSAGTHKLKAVYEGDNSGNINGSASKTITVTVTKPPKKKK